jgi:hypothetical protein
VSAYSAPRDESEVVVTVESAAMPARIVGRRCGPDA